MKRLAAGLFTALALTCRLANAAEAISTGYGKTFDEALQGAKTTAVEQVAGTFIVGNATVDGNTYHSRIDQYNGGLIKSYQVLSTQEKDGLIKVEIRADVDTDKVNSVLVSDGAEVPADMADKLAKSRDDYEKTAQIVSALDDPAKAFVVEIGKITYTNRGEMTDVEVQAQIALSPKWYDDVRVMARTIGREVEIGGGWSDALYALGALTAMVNPMLPANIFSIARRVEKPVQDNPEYMACFGRDNATDVDACYEIRQRMSKIVDSDEIRIGGTIWMGGRAVQVQPFAVRNSQQLFAEVAAGQKTYFTKSAKQRQFNNAGVLLFRQGVVPFRYKFTDGSEDMIRLKNIELSVL